VFDDDGRVTLDGIEILFLEHVAGLGGDEHLAGQGKSDAGVFRSDGLFGGESFIDTDDELGNVVKPRELGVIHDETEELAAIHVSVLALIFAALHIEKGLVKLEKSEAKRDEPLPRRGIVVRGIETGIRRIHFTATNIFSDSQEGNSKRKANEVRSRQCECRFNLKLGCRIR
jgi:hypothetical protein